MLKRLSTILLIAIAFAMTAIAQSDPPKNVIAVQGVYNREGVTLKNIRGEEFKYDADRDSVGFEVSYTRFLGKSPVGIGMDGGVTFHNKDVGQRVPCGAGCFVTNEGTSKVAVGFFNYKFVLQDRKGSFQPFAAALAGIQRGNFDGVSSGPGGSFRVGGGSTFVFGGEGGLDVKLGKGVFLRPSVTAVRGINRETESWHVRPKIGLAFKF